VADFATEPGYIVPNTGRIYRISAGPAPVPALASWGIVVLSGFMFAVVLRIVGR
jgi:hypothetical protein